LLSAADGRGEAGCNRGREITLRAPFVNNRLDPALLSPAAVRLSEKLPKTGDPCGQILWGPREIQDGHQIIGRIDYQRSGNHSLFGRYMATALDVPTPYSLSQNLLAAPTIGTDNLAQAFTFGDTYLFGSNVVNSFRLSANRSATRRIGASFFSGPDLGIRMFTYVPDAVNVNVTNAFAISCGVCSGQINIGVFALNDDVSWIRGNHQVAFGGHAAQANYNYRSGFFASGQFVFNGQATGLSLADFLTGNVFTLVQAPPNFQIARQRYFGLYTQDTWKVTPRLTLNAGLRWEPFLPQQRLDDGGAALRCRCLSSRHSHDKVSKCASWSVLSRRSGLSQPGW
jgi:outer membrane receptor protein involved in Fe transport